jgi:hypothetical protein
MTAINSMLWEPVEQITRRPSWLSLFRGKTKTDIIPRDKRRKEIKGTAHGTKKNIVCTITKLEKKKEMETEKSDEVIPDFY